MTTMLQQFPSKVRINVTQRDLQLGKRGMPEHCAGTRAARRKLGRFVRDPSAISAGISSVYVGVKGIRYDMPPALQQLIENFDYNRPCSPGRFTLTLKDTR